MPGAGRPDHGEVWFGGKVSASHLIEACQAIDATTEHNDVLHIVPLIFQHRGRYEIISHLEDEETGQIMWLDPLLISVE